ncbi:hypothetical protein ANTRET_LOCUS9455 [Anthophora retusa]
MTTYSENRGEIQDRRLFITRLAPYTKKQKLLELFKPRGAQHAVILHAWHDIKLITPRPDVNPFPGFDLSEPIPLPIECIAIIATFLPFLDRARLEMTSRRWRQGSLLSHQSIRNISLDDWRWSEGWDRKKVTANSLYWLVQRAGNRIKSVNLNNDTMAKYLQPQIITIIVKNCPYIETIDLTGTTIRPSAIRAIEPVAHQLTNFSIRTCQGPIEPHLINIFRSASHLKSFSTVGTNFFSKSITYISSDLQKLYLDKNDDLRTEHIAHTLSKLTTLEYLKIKSCNSLTNGDILEALSNNRSYKHSLKT